MACGFDDSLSLTLFPHKYEQAKCFEVKTVRMTVPPAISSELHCGRVNDIVSDDVQGPEPSFSQPWTHPMILDIVIMPQKENGARVVIALLLDESGTIFKAAPDGLRRLTVRTSQWDPSGEGVINPGDWQVTCANQNAQQCARGALLSLLFGPIHCNEIGVVLFEVAYTAHAR